MSWFGLSWLKRAREPPKRVLGIWVNHNGEWVQIWTAEETAMTFAKMLRILESLEAMTGHLPAGTIGCSGGGEITFEFKAQLSQEAHEYLKKKGFVDVDCIYYYRPL